MFFGKRRQTFMIPIRALAHLVHLQQILPLTMCLRAHKCGAGSHYFADMH